MNRTAAAACIAAVLSIAVCAGQGETRLAVAAPERTSVLDNGTTAVSRFSFAAGTREETHTHPFPILIVQITPGQLTVMDREMVRVGGRAGEVWFIPANVPHAATNRSTGSIAILQVGIKPERQPAPAAPPTTAPPGITRSTIVDNDDVRVVRVRFAPEGREPLHTHPNDLLTIQVTGGRVEIVMGAERSTAEREPGFVQFVGRGVSHAYASADSKPFELLSVAFK
ncbi:MAG TPA: cupin domain-containing protein [Vicinamibacterales bacterium]